MEHQKTREERLEETRMILEDLLGCPDELPEEFVSGHGFYARHKFRKNWFQGVCSNVQVVAHWCENQELMGEVREFMQRMSKKPFEEKTTREEIEVADQLIRKSLALINIYVH